MKKVKETLEEGRDIGVVMKKVMMDDYKKEISSLVPALIKDQSKIPNYILSQEKEFEFLSGSIEKMRMIFECDFDIIKAESSHEQKAKKAMPGKPSLIVD